MKSSPEAYASIVMENKPPSRNQSSDKNLDPSTGFDFCKRGKRNSFNINSFHHRTQNQNGRHHWRKTRLSKVEPRSVFWSVSIGHSYKSYANESLLFYFNEMYNVKFIWNNSFFTSHHFSLHIISLHGKIWTQ